MASKDDGKKDPLRAGDPKRPNPTLDLKAVEIKSDAKPGESKSGDTKSGDTKSADTKMPDAGKPAEMKPVESKPGETKSAATSVPPTSTAGPGDKPRAGSGAAAASSAGSAGTPESGAGRPPAGAGGGGKGGDGRGEGVAKGAAPTPAPARRGSGIGAMFSHLVAGIVGGFLALLGADKIAPQLGLELPGSSTRATEELRARLASVEKTVSSVASGTDADLAEKLASNAARLQKLEGLEGRIAGLTEAQSKLAAENEVLAKRLAEAPAGSGAPDPRIDELQQRLSLLTKAAEGSQGAGAIPQLAAVTGKLSDLEATLSNQLDALRQNVSQEIETRVAKAATSAEAAQSGTQRIDRELASVKTEAAGIAQRIETLKADNQRFSDALAAVQSEAGKLASALDALKSDMGQRFKSVARPDDVSAAVAPISQKLAAVEDRIEKVVTAEEGRKANAERIVLSLELANLKRAIDRGLGYGDELEQVKKAAGGKLDLAALDKHKADGVPTLADLQKDFRPLAHNLIDAAEQPENGGVIDRLLAGAKSVVRVRKTTHSADDGSVEAVVARMDKALADARISDFVQLAEKLPPAAKGAAQGFLQKIEARHAVDKALGEIQDQLKSSLGSASAAAAPK